MSKCRQEHKFLPGGCEITARQAEQLRLLQCYDLTEFLPETTRLSTKGQIVLPRAIRTSRAWPPGTEFTVEETDDGVLLRPAGPFPGTRLGQVAGCLRTKRRPATLAQMERALADEVARRHDSGS
jgi:AbrB family looped-hinge helix DNA binding protein